MRMKGAARVVCALGNGITVVADAGTSLPRVVLHYQRILSSKECLV